VKLAAVQRVELGKPGDFSETKSKADVIEQVEQRGGPKARKLFEKFIRDMAKLRDGDNAATDRTDDGSGED
jgi:hypothetical protein